MESTEMSVVQYQILVNVEDQYCLWPADLRLPDGWQSVGPKGDKRKCLDYIAEVWLDQRPRTLRETSQAS